MFGFAVHSLGDDAAVLGDLFHATRRVIIYLVSIVIWFSPIGILSLIGAALAGFTFDIAHSKQTFSLAETTNLTPSLERLGLYIATVMSALFIHACIILPMILYLVTKRNPIQYAANMMQVSLTTLHAFNMTFRRLCARWAPPRAPPHCPVRYVAWRKAARSTRE